MTTIWFFLATPLVLGRVRWVMNWVGERIRQRMLVDLAIAQIKLRSRTPDGSTSTDAHDPQVPSVRAGVEPAAVGAAAAPPAPYLPGVAAHHPRAAVPGVWLAPVDASTRTSRPPEASISAGAGATPPTSPAPAGPTRVTR